MTSIQERLQQLLDGELDPSEIADDPTLVSLADRLYGIKIAAVQPVKPRDATPSAPVPAAGSPTLSPTDLLVEVIGPAPVTRLAFRFPRFPQWNWRCLQCLRRNPRTRCSGCSQAVWSSPCSTCLGSSRRCLRALVQRALALAEVLSKRASI